MKFKFKARIYKVGINPCVKVPSSITRKMVPTKGYIPVKGKIENHNFLQTLVPIKNEGYRLYVNGPMLKGADVNVGETVNFTIEQDKAAHKNRNVPMPKQFSAKLKENNLMQEFKNLIPSRQKEILKYLNNLKTEESLMRNIDKVIKALNKTEPFPLFRLT